MDLSNLFRLLVFAYDLHAHLAYTILEVLFPYLVEIERLVSPNTDKQSECVHN